MALTAEEQAELAALEAEVGPAKKTASKKLSKEEQIELAKLEQELGPVAEYSGRLSGSVMGSEVLSSEPSGISGRGLPAAAPKDSFKDGLIRSGLNALPVAGGLIGGLAGTVAGLPTGPGAVATGVGGAALGAAGGEGYKQLGERYFFGENKSSEDAAKGILSEAVASGGAQAAGNVVGIAGKGLANTGAGKYVIGKIGSGLAKIGEAATGIPKKAIETYAKRAPKIAELSKKSGGDIQAAADVMRSKWNEALQTTRKSLNAQISKALENGAAKEVEVQPIIDALGKQQELINPKLYPEDLKGIDALIRRIHSLAKNGKLKLGDAQDVKAYLQDIATPAYNKGGQIFQHGKNVQRGAKAGARVARKGVAEQAPEIASANVKLSNLHNIENRMGRGLLKEGETTASIMGAGSGANPKNIKTLKKIGDATGQDLIGDAENLYAMKAFDDAPILPMDFTGKSLTRVGLGMGAGYALDGQDGAMAGAALTSPLLLKGLIRSGRGIGNVMSSGAGKQMAGRGLLKIQEYINQRRKEGATDEQIEQELGAAE